MEILTYRAFTPVPDDPQATSGNPAGVVLDAEELDRAGMLRIAADLGFSETAFLTQITPDSARIQYFTPRDEIAFCGHATIASGVALARRGAGPVVTFATRAGDVPVEVSTDAATLTAVDSLVTPLGGLVLDALLAALRLSPADLDPALPPAFVQGGNPHPLVFVGAGALERLDPDDDALLAVQNRHGWDGTVPVVHRLAADRFVSRNPFPRGGIREDPATGSAAASLGYYLRAGSHLPVPARVHVDQGAEIGRPSLIVIDIPAEGRVTVTGSVSAI